MYELLFYVGSIVLRIVQQIGSSCQGIQTVLSSRKEPPLVRVGAQRVCIALHTRNGIGLRIHGIRQDAEIRLSCKFSGDQFDVLVHLWTDAFAGGKEIFGHIYFSIHVFLGDQLTVLVLEGKSMHIAEHGQLHSSISGYEPGQREIETDEEQEEKANEESDFFLVHNDA